MVALWLLETVVVVALKVAVVAAAATVTEDGTVSVVFVSASETTAPPVGAAWLSVTVQVVEELAPKLVGLHASDEIFAGAVRLTIAVAKVLL